MNDCQPWHRGVTLIHVEGFGVHLEACLKSPVERELGRAYLSYSGEWTDSQYLEIRFMFL